jgi:polygalacturonase
MRAGLILAALAALATHARVLDIASDCGAVGDNATLNTAALAACVSRAAPGDTLLVPRGVFLTGRVALRARTTLRFADGGWLQGSADAADYGSDWDRWHVVSVINASGAAVVADSRGGGGVAGAMWQMVGGWDASQQMYTPRPWVAAGCYDTCRPMNLGVVDSDGVVLRDFALVDSASWTALLRRSSHALVDGLVIRGSRAWPNGDGIDVEHMVVVGAGLAESVGDCLAEPGALAVAEPVRVWLGRSDAHQLWERHDDAVVQLD